MASHTQATPSSSVDNEPHHDDRENAYDAAAARAYLTAHILAATTQHPHNNNAFAIDENRPPRTLGSPFRTPSRGSTSTKRSRDDSSDDDGSSTARPRQRARYNDSRLPTPPPPAQFNILTQQWQAAAPALPHLHHQGPELQNAAREILPFDGFLHQSGLPPRDHQVVQRPELPIPVQGQCRLRRTNFDFAAPIPYGRENHLLPEPRPGPEHFVGGGRFAPRPALDHLLQPLSTAQPLRVVPSPQIAPPAGRARPGPQQFAPQPLPPPHQLLRPRSPPPLFPPASAAGHAPHEQHLEGHFDLDVGYFDQGGYYHPYQAQQPPPSPARRQQRLPWLGWDQMSIGHPEARLASAQWEEGALELGERLEGRIEGVRGW